MDKNYLKKEMQFSPGKGKFEVIEMDYVDSNSKSCDTRDGSHSGVDMCSSYCSRHCPNNTGGEHGHMTGSESCHMTGSTGSDQCHKAWHYRQQQENWDQIVTLTNECERHSPATSIPAQSNHELRNRPQSNHHRYAHHQLEAEEGSLSADFEKFNGFNHYFNGFKKFHLIDPLDPIDPPELEKEEKDGGSWFSEFMTIICTKKVKRKPFRHKPITWRTYLVDYIHLKNEVNLYTYHCSSHCEKKHSKFENISNFP